MNEPLDLLSQNRSLHERLEEAEAVLAAARSGTLDALVVGAPGSEQIYTRKGADAPYRMFVEAMHEGAATVDATGCVLYSNEALARLLGRPLRNVIGSVAREMVVPEHRDEFDALLRSSSASGAQRAIELLAADGSSAPVLATAGALEAGGNKVALVVTDLRKHERGAAARALLEQSERSRRALLSLLEDQTRTEQTLRKSNRALRTLSAGNEALVRATNEADLLKAMTRILHDVGGYPVCVVGYAVEDERKTIDIQAFAGLEPGKLDHVEFSWGDNERGQFALSRAIRDGKTQVVRNIAAWQRDPVWRERMSALGLNAIVALPLRIDGEARAVGAISVGTSDADAFDAAEVRLLEELAGDVAYGVANLRARLLQRKADEEIRVLARFPDENPNAVMRIDKTGLLLYANHASQPFLQACGVQVGLAVPEPCRTFAAQALATACVLQEDISLGASIYAVTFAPVVEAGYVNLYGIDITARKHAEDTLHAALVATVEAIAATVETRDPYTAGHQRRVAELAAAIALEMGLPAKTVEGIHFGALVHDLGKMQVPAELLSKPTRLTKIEFELIKTHPQAGYEIVKDIKFPWPVADMVHQHHERLDGSGYPQGLKGDAIALEARILAVADVFEAMSSHRPYRASLGIEPALKEIQDRRGTWYEPAAVDACVRLLREKNFVLAKS